MSIKNLIIGGIVGGIVLFLLGFLVYGKLLGHFFMTHHALPEPGYVYRTEMMLGYIFLANVCAGLLLTFVLLKANVKSILEGITIAAVIGFLMSGSIDNVSYATTVLMSKKAILVDMAAYTVLTAITGAVIAFVLSKLKSA